MPRRRQGSLSKMWVLMEIAELTGELSRAFAPGSHRALWPDTQCLVVPLLSSLCWALPLISSPEES